MLIIRNKAQALTELAVFGSILLMLLGILLHYGLKYNAQQRITQKAFRKALGVVAENIASGSSTLSANYMIVEDTHIPSPENPFGMGSAVPISSQASVSRSHRMMDAPTLKSDLPMTHIDINGQYPSVGGEQRNYFYTAAFRDETNVPLSQIEDDYDCDGDGAVDEGVSKYGCVYGAKGTTWWEQGDGACTCDKVSQANPQTGDEEMVCPDRCKTKNIRIADDCDGEIVSLDTVGKRCHQISKSGINEPWYCKKAELCKDEACQEQYKLFSFNPDGAMGLQEDYAQKTRVANTLKKEESVSDIKTTETLDWRFITDRKIIYNNNIENDGTSKRAVNTTPVDIKSVLCHNGKCKPGTRNPQKRTYTTTW